MVLLVQNAPPLATVLAEHGETLADLVCVLGDDQGLCDEEAGTAERLCAEVAGGGPLLRASLGSGCLLASQCIVILHHYFDSLHECPARLWEGGSEVRRNLRQKRRQKLRTAGRPASFVRDFSSYAKLCRLEQELEEPETFGHDYDDDVDE